MEFDFSDQLRRSNRLSHHPKLLLTSIPIPPNALFYSSLFATSGIKNAAMQPKSLRFHNAFTPNECPELISIPSFQAHPLIHQPPCLASAPRARLQRCLHP